MMTRRAATASWPMTSPSSGTRSRSAESGGCAGSPASNRCSPRARPATRKPARPSTTTWSTGSSAPRAPNTLWLTDITEHRTREAKVYLCAIKDVFSNRIVGYSIDSRMKARIAVNALEMAVAHRGRPTGVIVHSDRGSQFRSRRFLKALKRHGLTGSMGRVGACGDNAAMESFFALLQKNVLDRRSWSTREELRLAIVSWIQGKYHRKRRQRRLGKLTPVEFELIMKPTATLAA